MTRSASGLAKLSVYQLRIGLDEIQPIIWRTLWIPGKVRLSRLHRVIQNAMGWQNYHLHEFSIADTRYGMTEIDEDLTLLDERRFSRLALGHSHNRIHVLVRF